MFEPLYKTRRNRIMNYIGWGLLALVCIIFVFIDGTSNVSFLGNSSSVAQVNSQPISYNDFNRFYERNLENMKSQKLSMNEKNKLKKETVESLINRTLILDDAKAQSIFIPPAEIADYLMQIPQLQEKGQFSLVKYKEIMKAQGMNEAVFEEKVAQDMLVQKMNEFYLQSTKEDNWIKNHEEQMSQATLSLSFVRWPKDKLALDITPAEVDAYIQKNKDSLMADYNKEKSQAYTQKEEVSAQHILIKTSPAMPEEKALAKIKEIAQKITPANFAEMAKKYSDDPGSKERGGELGFFSKEKMVPEFSKAAFSLPVGKISEPVKTSYGYHLIKVTDKKAEKVLSFDEVKAQIARQKLEMTKSQDAVKAFREELAKASDQEAMTLIAKKGGTWEDTGAFTLNDPTIPKMGLGIGESENMLLKVVQLTEQKPLLKELIEKDNFVYVLKYHPLAVSKVIAKNENQDFFKQIMARQESYEMFQSWMQQLRKDAKIKINHKILDMN